MQGVGRQQLAGGLAAIGGISAVIFGMAVIDPRVRAQFTQMLANGGPTSEMVAATGQVRTFLFVLLQAVRDQSMDHAPLVIFGLAALVLVMFMLRT